MIETEAEKEFSKGLKALQEGNSLAALSLFREGCQPGDPAGLLLLISVYALQRNGARFRRGLLLCREALEKEPENTVHYLNLGRIHLVAGNKQEAIRIFRKGLAFGPESGDNWVARFDRDEKSPLSSVP